MRSVDTILGLLEFALWPLSLGLLVLAGSARGRHLPRLPKLAIALVIVTALIVAQPFGVRAEELQAGSRPAFGRVGGTETLSVLGVGLVRFSTYERPISHLGLGECCPAQDTLKVRSSFVVPGLLTHATSVTDLHGDGVPRSWVLRRQDGAWTIVASAYAASQPDPAWELKPGVVSSSGIVYWLAAAVGVPLMLRRRRRPPGAGGPASPPRGMAPWTTGGDGSPGEPPAQDP